MQCPDGDTPTFLVGFGVISLDEGCTITSEDFWYSHTYAGMIEINLGFGNQEELSEDDEEDINYDISNFENDVIFNEDVEYTTTTTTTPKPNDSDAVVLENEIEEEEVSTVMTTLSDQEETTVTNEIVEEGIEVQNPVEKGATEIYKDLLVKLKDTLAARWVIA